MLLTNGCISPDTLAELESYSDLIECECPSHLMAILAEVRKFSDYTTQCIDKYPADANTHRWLQAAAKNVDVLLSTTIVQLARMEGFVNDDNNLVPRAQVKKPTPKNESSS
ncbi:MAG: hypothetical protein EOO38_04670 [Cytophagaceae bacterium]|nr:MAG: hypothetical protein EOO38_04670 [Cytophagaceae bacterium]